MRYTRKVNKVLQGVGIGVIGSTVDVLGVETLFDPARISVFNELKVSSIYS